MRISGVIRCVVLLITLLGTWFIMQTYFHHSWKAISLRSWLGATKKPSSEKLPRHKCGNQKSCPKNYFAFKIVSGAANVVGPSICFEGLVLMSSVKNNIGRGLNIALVNGTTGQLLKTDSFDMYSGDITNLENFLQGIKSGTLVLTASYDDPATKMTDTVRARFMELGSSHVNITNLENFLQGIKSGTLVLTASYDDPATKMTDTVRARFMELGSSHVSELGFRDNWIFLGAKGLMSKTPFEKHIKNDKETNKYDGWPELLEMEGCAPRKMD